jgi:hypothetical protein
MNWVDSNGTELIMGDYVWVENMIHRIELLKIKGKNKMKFRPYPKENVLVEYHYISYAQAQKRGIIKILDIKNVTPS